MQTYRSYLHTPAPVSEFDGAASSAPDSPSSDTKRNNKTQNHRYDYSGSQYACISKREKGPTGEEHIANADMEIVEIDVDDNCRKSRMNQYGWPNPVDNRALRKNRPDERFRHGDGAQAAHPAE